MPLMLLGLLPGLLKSKVFWYAIAALALVAAALWGVHHLEQIGAAREIAKVQAATAAETARRDKVLADTQAYFAPYVEALDKSEKHNADIQADIDRLSAANNARQCLDAAAVNRLRAIGAGGHQSGH